MKWGSQSRNVTPAPAPRIEPRQPSDLTVHPNGSRIGELLVRAGQVTAEQVTAALTVASRGTPRYLGEILVDMGAIADEALIAVVAAQRGLDLVSLDGVNLDKAATALMSEAVARDLLAIPLSIHADLVEVAIAVPAEGLASMLREAVGRPVWAHLAPRAEIIRAIDRSYRALSGVESEVRAFEATHSTRPEAARTDAAADGAPVVRVVQLIITQALRDRASDIHIEPHPAETLIRYRIDGALHDVQRLPVAMAPVIASRIKIMAGLNIVERRRPQDGQISLEVEGHSVDIRVSTTAVMEGEKVVLRLLDKSRQLYGLTQLGMADDMVAKYSAVLRMPYGMVVCAGPTGSGKTTTLYGSLGHINNPERNVMTIEDPVEYRIPSTNQIQINEAAGITFAGGLRSILRQDPDVILVGEIRDPETARIAVQAALTGHLVLSSLHATDSAAAVHRLLDMGIEGFLIASSVTGVLTQRLVRRTCTRCPEPYIPSAEEYAFLSTINGVPPAGGFTRGRGCSFCANTGFHGRVGVFELMPVTEPIRELIVGRGAHDEIRKTARSEGMRTLQEEAARLVESGVTTLSEVLRSIYVIGN